MNYERVSRITLVLVVLATFALATSSVLAQTKLCLDPGHGGSDPGAVGNGLQEKTVNLDTANRLKTWLDIDTADTGGGGSWSVYRTRSTDVAVSLSGRTTYANNNGVARFMSIHANAASDTSAKGIETFCYTSGSSYSFDLRNKVYEEAIAMWPLTQRGKKTANFYVLVYTNMPSELHEMAFITNATDAGYLGSSTHRDNHAKSEMFAVQRHYGYAKYTPSTAVERIVDNTSSGFSASSNWWTSTSTAGYYGSNYHVRGTASVSDAATWTANLPSSGSYKVYAWWTGGSNRAASAPYIVYHSSGSTTVNVNQQVNGGKWNLLGTYNFGSGNQQVKLSCWTTAGYYVIADAVRFYK
jgi:N-acetylmuramoyl-L-alanine amidase